MTNLKEEREALEDTKQDLSIARDEIESLQDKIRQLESGSDENDGNELRLEIERLQNANTELQGNLEQFTSWAEEAQKKIAGILGEKQALERTIKDLTESNTRLSQIEIAFHEKLVEKEMERSQLEMAGTERENLIAELTSEKEKLVEALNDERFGVDQLKEQIALLTQQGEEANATII